MDGYGGGGGGDGHGDHAGAYRNPYSTTSSSPQEDHDGGDLDRHRPGNSRHNHHHHHHHSDNHNQHERHHRRNHHYNHHNPNGEPKDSNCVGAADSGSSHSLPFSGRKRTLLHSGQGALADCADFVSVVKLYIGGVPRTTTEEDIRSVFEEYGNIVEVIFINDKKTGQQQECCFVKYSKLEEGDRAIGALHDRFTFSGGLNPIKVKYADGERERLGVNGHFHKLYIGGLNRQGSKRDIEEVFSPYGIIEEIFIVRDERKQNRGCAFVQFLRREMAISAINALHGTFIMRGCEKPLIVRFAEPKKPKNGESRLPPSVNDSVGQHMLLNDPPSPKQPSQNSGSSSVVLSNTTVFDQNLPTTTSSTPAVPSEIDTEDFLDCDWSEHICPDGFKYYYNCVSCESRWEKPEEFIICEQELEKLQLQHHPHQQQHSLPSLPAPAVECPMVAADCV